MSLTVPAQQVQTPLVRQQPLVQQPQIQAPTQPVLNQTAVPATSTLPINDQTLINPTLQGPSPAGDAERVASQPGQVAFVDGQQPADPQTCKIAISKDGKSNNPLETFTFGGAISSITAAVASLFVGMPSKCYGPVVQPLVQRFEPTPTTIPEWAKNPAKINQSPASQTPQPEPAAEPVPVAPLPALPSRPEPPEATP